MSRRFTIALLRAGLMLSITLAGGSSPAAPRSGAEILALTEPPAYRLRIGADLVMRNMMMENTRRALLVGRCSVYDKNFPKVAAPAMERVMRKVEDWALRGDRSLVDAPFLSTETDRLMEAVARNTFTDTEVDGWASLRSTPSGRRAAAIWSMLSAMDKIQELGLSDVMSGTEWYWPLAQLRKLADDVDLRAPFDAAINRIQPGGAADVARVGDSPSVPNDLRLHKVVTAAESGALAKAFAGGISREDRAAVDRLIDSPFLARWSEVTQQFGTIAVTQVSAQEACARARLSHCQSGSDIDLAVKALRSKWNAPGTGSYPMPVLQQMLRKIPEAGCRDK